MDSDLARFTLKNYDLEYFAEPIGSVRRGHGCFPNKLPKTTRYHTTRQWQAELRKVVILSVKNNFLIPNKEACSLKRKNKDLKTYIKRYIVAELVAVTYRIIPVTKNRG